MAAKRIKSYTVRNLLLAGAAVTALVGGINEASAVRAPAAKVAKQHKPLMGMIVKPGRPFNGLIVKPTKPRTHHKTPKHRHPLMGMIIKR